MAATKGLVFAMLLIAFAFVLLVESAQMAITTQVDSPLPGEIDCGEACDARCQLSSRQKICKRACGTCCARCQCVPPGTSGNYDVCPCYANMTTHGGRHKCP
ncbi:gibberellin-regulated protein 11-like [Cucurbita pepo subsp. pepo]|uniref:gibberellin-regulated protein 11-like n=1 Tax=Cucurbita pepo subsp. pepo TaxID=3664 RepID=UPI000C9D36B2|nr:gibberellin-regulated protein 11-like [Cucurbita pepo subsp. pepo]